MDPLGHAHRFKAKLLHAYSIMKEDDARRSSCKYCIWPQSTTRNEAPPPHIYNKLHHFLSIILAMAKGERQDLWNVESQGPILAMNFGRFMAWDEFENILRSLQLSMFGKDDLQLDPWIPFRPAIECFNHSPQAGISPGTSL